MSTISNTHNITSYTTGVTKPFSSQRLATVTYKTDKKTGIKPDSVCASIPPVSKEDVLESINSFLPHIISLVERTQDAIVRNAHENGRNVISSQELSVSSVLEFLSEESSSGGRITKKDAQEWFDANVSDPLAIALAAKMGVSEIPTQEESDRIEALLSAFKENVSSLTAGNVKHDVDTCNAIRKCIMLVPQVEEDSIGVKFLARLDTLSRKVPKSIADAL